MEENVFFDLVAFGKSSVDYTYLVDNYEQNNTKVPIYEEYVSGGGQAATTAVIVSLLGGRSAYVGNIGWDERGMLLLKEFRRFGVDCRWIQRPNNFETPKAIILVDKNSGNRKIFYQKKQTNFKCPLPQEAFKNCKVLILDPDISISDFETIKNWKRPDTLILYDAERSRESLSVMKQFADFFIASETLLDLDLSISREAAINSLLSEVRGELIITFGEHGSIWWKDKRTLIHIPALQQDNICDTTGAGDVFHAAFGYFFPKVQDIVLAIKYATCCASFSTTIVGTRQFLNFHQNLESSVLGLTESTLSQLPKWMRERIA